ncbi:MAG: tetratricopeptide repeat protein [Planctomycetota bacterium]|nr:tetratricopeptide repeat protein [Planctomycetota bacterium]
MSKTTPNPTAPDDLADTRWSLDFSKLLPILLITCALVAYANSFKGVFILDDNDHIVNNTVIRTVFPLADKFPPNDRRIVPKWSYVLNYVAENHISGNGLEPRGYHLLNLSVHIVAGLALFGVVRRTLWLPRFNQRFDRSASWLAFTVALFWMLHPLQTQAVTYIVQRIESLMGMFFFLMLYAAIRSDEGRGARQWLWWGATLLACLLGMLSKEIMATAPIVLILYDRTFLTTSALQSLRRRWPLYASLSLPYLAAASLGLADMFSAHATAGFATPFYRPTDYLLAQTQVVLYYIRMAFWPHPLCLDYFDWVPPSPISATAPYAAAVALLVALSLWGTWRRHWLGFLGLSFFIVLAPTSSVMPLRDLVMEHRMYVPLAAIIIAVVVGGWSALRWAMLDRPEYATYIRWTGGALVCATALTLGLRTAVRNLDYHSQIAMYRSITVARPRNPRGWRNYSAGLAQESRLYEAKAALTRSLELVPGDVEGWIGLAMMNYDMKDMKRAATILRQVSKWTTNNEMVYYDLGAIVMETDPVEAEWAFREALRIKPDMAQARNSVALLLMQRGKQEEAVEEFKKAIATNPKGGSEGYNNLAGLLLNLNRTDEAIEAYRMAIKNSPDLALFSNNLGRALLKAGRFAEAEQAFNEAQAKAKRLDDTNAQADTMSNLGDLASRLGQLDRAILYQQQALKLRPGWPEYMRRIAWIRATSLPPYRDPSEALALAQVSNTKTGNGVPDYLDTLAAAYASTGQFQEAAKTARRALALAGKYGQPRLEAELPARIAAYDAGKPWYVAPPDSPKK